MITIMKRRLDRITLVRRFTTSKSGDVFLGAFAFAKSCVSNGELKLVAKKPATVFSKFYAGNGVGTGISFKFFSIQKKPAIAINATPSKFSNDDWADFLSLLTLMFPFGPEQVWTEFRLSRLEVAVDIEVPLNEFVCLAPKVGVVDVAYLKDGTLYLGHRYGRRSYCIYDKKKQLAEKMKVDLESDLTRVEVRLRHTGKTLGQLDELCKPFGNLLVLKRSRLVALCKKFPQAVELKSFVSAVVGGGVAQNAYLEMDPYSRKLLLARLKPMALNLNGREQHWADWVSKQQLSLKAKFLG